MRVLMFLRGWVWVGWANNVRLLFYTYVMPSCYATVRSLELSHIGHPTLLCFLLLFYTYVIRYATLHFHTSKQASKQTNNQPINQTNKQTRHVPLEKKTKTINKPAVEWHINQQHTWYQRL